MWKSTGLNFCHLPINLIGGLWALALGKGQIPLHFLHTEHWSTSPAYVPLLSELVAKVSYRVGISWFILQSLSPQRQWVPSEALGRGRLRVIPCICSTHLVLQCVSKAGSHPFITCVGHASYFGSFDHKRCELYYEWSSVPIFSHETRTSMTEVNHATDEVWVRHLQLWQTEWMSLSKTEQSALPLWADVTLMPGREIPSGTDKSGHKFV